jgi:hypothetical protein
MLMDRACPPARPRLRGDQRVARLLTTTALPHPVLGVYGALVSAQEARLHASVEDGEGHRLVEGGLPREDPARHVADIRKPNAVVPGRSERLDELHDRVENLRFGVGGGDERDDLLPLVFERAAAVHAELDTRNRSYHVLIASDVSGGPDSKPVHVLKGRRACLYL